jgi:hypothetical protein
MIFMKKLTPTFFTELVKQFAGPSYLCGAGDLEAGDKIACPPELQELETL